MKKMSFLMFLFVLCVGFPAFLLFADVSGLESLLEQKDLWELSPDGFLTDARKPLFRWLSKEKDAVRFPGYSNSPQMPFLGLKIWEAVVRFEKGKLNAIDVSLYNRGDAGELNEDDFEKLLDDIDKKTTEWAGEKGVELSARRLPGNKGKIRQKVWVKGSSNLLLEWSTGGSTKKTFRAEYVKFAISKFNPENDLRKMSKYSSQKTDTRKPSGNLMDNVTRKEDGTVYIENVPMVDQGQKGYCAVAVTERVLRYYGGDVEQHVIAQLADTTSGGGTSPDMLFKMLKKAGVKLRIKVKVYKEASNSLEFMRELEKYNKLAKREKKPTIRVINGFDENYGQLKKDMETYKKFKCEKDKVGYKHFISDIKKNIDSGIPLIWGLVTGLVEEPEAKSLPIGGHMRLIIGYNDKTETLVFSDSWGAGHEFKIMPYDDAWTVTTGYAIFIPRKNR